MEQDHLQLKSAFILWLLKLVNVGLGVKYFVDIYIYIYAFRQTFNPIDLL